VTAGSLWVLFESTSVGRAKEIIDHVSFPLLAAGATALLATSPFSALRWHLVLAAETTSPGPWTLLKIVLVGLFFNQVFPSSVGGDAVRAWRCHRLGIGAAAAIRSLVLDRVNGYSVLVMLYAAGLPVLLRSLPDARQRYGAVILLAAALCGLLAPFLIDYLPQKLLRYRLVAEFAALSHEGPPAVRLAGAVRGRFEPLCRHYGTYNPRLHAGGGESRCRSLLAQLGCHRTTGHAASACSNLPSRVGGARTRSCRPPHRVRNPGRGGAHYLAVGRRVPDPYRITRWFIVAHRLGHHTSDPQAEGARRRPARSIKLQPNQAQSLRRDTSGRTDESPGTRMCCSQG
jgi:hypothetical protein